MVKENQLCTIEQGKKLSDLGIKWDGKTLFVHKVTKNEKSIELEGYFTFEVGDKLYPAFTVAELGVMLPNFYKSNWGANLNNWASYHDGKVLCYRIGKTEAQARADMLIYLLENKLITPEEVNKRLENA